MADKSKISSLDDALAQIEKQFGKGAIMKLGEAPIQKVDFISHAVSCLCCMFF